MARNDATAGAVGGWRGALRAMVIAATVLGVAASSAPRTVAQDDGDGVPTREDVADFVAGLRADLFTCGRGWHGALELEIVFARSGAVTDVTVRGDGAPGHVSSCVASVVRGGHIRPFTEPAAVVEQTIRL